MDGVHSHMHIVYKNDSINKEPEEALLQHLSIENLFCIFNMNDFRTIEQT